MSKWKKTSDRYECFLGNNLYIVIKPVMVYGQDVRNNQLCGKYKERRLWCPEVLAGRIDVTPVRRWGGGGDGHGNYRTLAEAKVAGMQEARYVAQAITNQLDVMRRHEVPRLTDR